jgi:hypothetical protein
MAHLTQVLPTVAAAVAADAMQTPKVLHELDDHVLEGFPTAASNSRANAVVMARCALMSYDR